MISLSTGDGKSCEEKCSVKTGLPVNISSFAHDKPVCVCVYICTCEFLVHILVIRAHECVLAHDRATVCDYVSTHLVKTIITTTRTTLQTFKSQHHQPHSLMLLPFPLVQESTHSDS